MEMTTMMKKKQNNQMEVDATQSVLHDNVSLISKDKIQGEALSFDDWSDLFKYLFILI